MRPVNRGACPTDGDGNDILYPDYAKARGELITRMGQYCSYCEMKLDTDLAVEHILPKKPPGHAVDIVERVRDWNNFLLACRNCNSTKGSEDIALPDYFWPHLDNTTRALSYSIGGVVRVNSQLPPALKAKAELTITLTGLDKTPSNDPAMTDRRLLNRRETWDIAVESKQDLIDSPSDGMKRQIVRTAKAQGYWSVWMTVFEGDADMRQRLINAMPGTAQDCFDGNSQPVARPGGQI